MQAIIANEDFLENMSLELFVVVWGNWALFEQ